MITMLEAVNAKDESQNKLAFFNPDIHSTVDGDLWVERRALEGYIIFAYSGQGKLIATVRPRTKWERG